MLWLLMLYSCEVDKGSLYNLVIHYLLLTSLIINLYAFYSVPSEQQK